MCTGCAASTVRIVVKITCILGGCRGGVLPDCIQGLRSVIGYAYRSPRLIAGSRSG